VSEVTTEMRIALRIQERFGKLFNFAKTEFLLFSSGNDTGGMQAIRICWRWLGTAMQPGGGASACYREPWRTEFTTSRIASIITADIESLWFTNTWRPRAESATNWGWPGA
jgi:hypothetical protein